MRYIRNKCPQCRGAYDFTEEDSGRGSSCPHCGAADSEVISLFGAQAMTLQYRCRRCGTCYEALKYEEQP